MAVERNSDGSYDAVDSGGFGKDYHGQDAFGERIGGTGIGGSHFGGFAAGHVGLDKDNTIKNANNQKYEKLSYGDITQTESMPKSAFEADNSNESSAEEAGSGMREGIRDLNSESSEENNNVGSLDTSFQIGENEDEKEKSDFTDKTEQEKSKELEAKADEDIEKAKAEEEKAKEEKAKAEEEKKSWEGYIGRKRDRLKELKELLTSKETSKKSLLKSAFGRIGDSIDWGLGVNNNRDDPLREVNDILTELSSFSDVKIDTKSLTAPLSEFYDADSEVWRNIDEAFNKQENSLTAKANDNLTKATEVYENKVAERAKKEELKSSFTDKTKEEEAKAGPNMAKASVGESDYLTKANKDSTKKEVPTKKEGPSRNDYPNHIVGTLKGVVDKIADNTTAKALGIQSIEDFAKENGVDPNKFSTMKAYRSYQNKQIWKAIPNLFKKVGGYVVERIKDFFDLSQAPERTINTVARYNGATLLGAVILSIKSGAGLQASIDQALTMVDPEDQPEVSDFLESILNDEGIVADLSNAFDDALAPEQTSNTAELDESIVNIGRKDNTDYSDFNAGLGTSGTTSDADVKVFISRNVKADPVLRRMISKMGK